MKCNICDNDMMKGYIPLNREYLLWVPEEVTRPMGAGVPNGAVQLSKKPVFKAIKTLSYYCSSCEVIVTPRTLFK